MAGSGAFASKSATELDSDLFGVILDAIVSFDVIKNALVNFRIKLNLRGAIGTRMRAGRKDTNALECEVFLGNLWIYGS